MAGEGSFADGFKEGYRAIKGNHVLMPLIPLAPLTPLGKTPFQVGLLMGMEHARR